MSVFALYLVRDEADIIEHTISRMLDEVDDVLVLDNGSVDGTREILDSLAVEVFDDDEPAHYQSRKMTWLAARALERGAEWVLACDADEVWYSPHGRIADILPRLPGAVVPAAIYNHRATDTDSEGASPIETMGWRDRAALPLHKVACRPALPVTITEGNHGAHFPSQAPEWDQLIVRHFPYRSVEQFVRKVRNGAAALAATNLPSDIGTHWRQYGQILEARGPEGIAEIFYRHFYSEDPVGDPLLIFDPVPAACPSPS